MIIRYLVDNISFVLNVSVEFPYDIRLFSHSYFFLLNHMPGNLHSTSGLKLRIIRYMGNQFRSLLFPRKIDSFIRRKVCYIFIESMNRIKTEKAHLKGCTDAAADVQSYFYNDIKIVKQEVHDRNDVALIHSTTATKFL